MAVIIIPVHQAKHYTTLIRLSTLLRDLCSLIPNLQCYRALWIGSSLHKISVQRNYSFIHLVTNINIWCPVLLNYLGLLCKLQSSEITAKIRVTIFNVQINPFLMFLDHTQRCSTVGRTPPDEWSARRRDLYLTTHDTHNRQISMPPMGFEPKISAG